MEKKEKKKIFWFCLAGFLFVGAFGAVSHFFYEWSGKEPLVGVFFAANESVWEHLKPAIFPTLVFFLIGSVFLDAPNVLPAFFATLILPMLLIPAIFYGYTAFTGEPIVAVDIATYFVSVAAAFALCFFVLTRPPRPKWVSALAVPGIAAVSVCYLAFTLFPPHAPLFLDPVTGGYGLV